MSVGAAVDEAVIGRLQTDPTLQGLAPGGIYLGRAPEGKTDLGVVVLVNLQDERTEYKHGGASHRITRLQVKASGRNEDTTAIKAAFDRFDALLDGASFAVAPYTLMDIHRAEDNGRFLLDEVDGPFVWWHCGADYEVWSAI